MIPPLIESALWVFAMGIVIIAYIYFTMIYKRK